MTEAAFWFELAKAVGAFFGPFLALGGAIILYFWKQRADRMEARRNERVDLYSSMLSHADQIYDLISKGPPFDELSRAISQFRSEMHRLQLLAPTEVTFEATYTFEELAKFGGVSAQYDDHEAWSTAARDGLLQPSMKEARRRIVHLVEAMRRDVEPRANAASKSTSDEG